MPDKQVQGFLSGYAAAAPSVGQVLGAMVATRPGRIRVVMCAASAGTGAGVTVVDVLRNGMSMYTNPSYRPSLAAGASGKFSTQPPNNGSVRLGDVLQVVCAAAGGHPQLAATAMLEEP